MAGTQIGAALQYPSWTSHHRCRGRISLSRDLWEKLKDKKTSLTKFTINDVVRSGLLVPSSDIGVYAGDEECYYLFRDVFDPITKECHGINEIPVHISNLDPRSLTSVIKNKAPIRSTRCRVESDEYQAGAGIGRDWPEGRGIFYNNAKTFLAWVNEEDHLRIISMQKGANVEQVFDRLCRGINAINKALLKQAQTEFAFHKQYGYLSSCPTNLGTGMRASVHMHIPNTLTESQFKNRCCKLGLDVRGRHGEKCDSDGGVYDVSNLQRLGSTEVEQVQTLVDGINSI
ncbi:creatine kinase M-type-like [Branchiostoma floridae]|uniref:creatine kinase n=1 Tax=Branchiostoma floridae TaxID=7739 RepID=A0A9J7MF43_BRAFL|nr:creatine kinase M-type-like [Branchiostoma floridae]